MLSSLEELKRQGQQSGFQDSGERPAAWSLLCRQYLDDELQTTPNDGDEPAEQHREYGQILTDVNRTLQRFPPDLADDDRQQLMSTLTPLVVNVLMANPKASYYQGFHDVCLTVLLVLDDRASAQFVCNCLAKTYFRPFLEQPMEVTSHYIDRILYGLLAAENFALYDHLKANDVPALFALSWLITWFSHDCDSLQQIARLYDLFLASEPEMPLYVAAVLICRFQEDIFRLCDTADIYKALLYLPKSMVTDEHVDQALALYRRRPPGLLRPAEALRPVGLPRLLAYGALGAGASAVLVYVVYSRFF